MPIKMGNNAVAHLAAPLGASDTTIVLVSGEVGGFPGLTAGDWFPMTLADSAGHLEIVRVTARSGNILTALRGQESTTARAWSAGDRAENRMTAAVIDFLQAATSAVQADLDATETTLTTSISTLSTSTATNLTNLHTQVTSELAVALSALIPVGFGPVPWSGPDEPAGWAFADGRVLTSATPYTALRSYYISKSFPHGQDGSGNPKIPDMRGRTAAGVDGGAARLTGATLGAALGTETHVLTTAQLPSHAHTASTAGAGSHAHGGSTDNEADHAHTASSSTAGSHTHTTSAWSNSGGGIAVSATGAGLTAQSAITSSTHAGHTHPITVGAGGAHSHAITTDTTAAHTHAVTVDAAGSGAAHPNVQPTLVLNYIIKAT